MNNKRRKFLTEACPNIVFALFGLSYLEACSSAKDDDQNMQVNNNNNTSPGESSGITTEGNNINIDLSNAVNRKNNKIQLDGNFKISLNEFGVKAPSFMLAEMKDLIDLSFSLEFIK